MKKRILIVEDELSIVQLLSLVLAKAGYEIHICQSGREAIGKMKQLHPHLVLLDVMLPGLDGRTIVSIMDEDDALSNIPIIITSALVESEAMFTRFAQVRSFCAKPFVLKDLVNKVKEALGDL